MLCRQCGYILDGIPSRQCPECGRAFEPADRRTWAITHRSFRLRRLRQVTAAVLLLGTATYTVLYLTLLRRTATRPATFVFASGLGRPLPGPWPAQAEFSHGEAAAGCLFAPAVWVDQKLFPARWRQWDPPELSYVF